MMRDLWENHIIHVQEALSLQNEDPAATKWFIDTLLGEPLYHHRNGIAVDVMHRFIYFFRIPENVCFLHIRMSGIGGLKAIGGRNASDGLFSGNTTAASKERRESCQQRVELTYCLNSSTSKGHWNGMQHELYLEENKGKMTFWKCGNETSFTSNTDMLVKRNVGPYKYTQFYADMSHGVWDTYDIEMMLKDPFGACRVAQFALKSDSSPRAVLWRKFQRELRERFALISST